MRPGVAYTRIVPLPIAHTRLLRENSGLGRSWARRARHRTQLDGRFVLRVRFVDIAIAIKAGFKFGRGGLVRMKAVCGVSEMDFVVVLGFMYARRRGVAGRVLVHIILGNLGVTNWDACVALRAMRG